MQAKRVDNFRRDESKLFLIGYKYEKLKHTFTMKNSSNDDSKSCNVNINGDKTISCTCSDYKFRCYKNNIVCKHCLFILKNGLKLDMNILSGRVMNVNEEELKVLLNNVCIARDIKSDFVYKELTCDDVCPICLENFMDGDNNMCCLECKNYVHKECISVWMKNNKTCVYCRSLFRGI